MMPTKLKKKKKCEKGQRKLRGKRISYIYR